MPPQETATANPRASHHGVTGCLSVEIYDQTYRLSGVDMKHMDALAALVDSKMRAVSAHGATVDSLRVAVLAALNIADELIELRARHHELLRSLDTSESTARHRAHTLSEMLDVALRDDCRRLAG